MEEQIFVAVCIGFFGVLLITAPIFRLYLIEKKENDSRKEQERLKRYCRKRGINPDENLGHMSKEPNMSEKPIPSMQFNDANIGHSVKDRLNISDGF